MYLFSCTVEDHTMAAMSAGFVTAHGPACGIPFGGLIDLSRMLLQGSQTALVVCSACQTINRDSARVCKGCGGKLLAFYTAGGAGNASPDDAGTRAMVAQGAHAFAAALLVFAKGCAVDLLALCAAGCSSVMSFGAKVGRAGMAPGARALGHTALWVKMIPAALFVAFGLLYAAPPGMVAPVAEPTPTADPLNVLPLSRAVFDRSVEPPLTSSQATRARIREERPDLLRRATLPQKESRAPALIHRHYVPDPLALCSGFTFVAHAVCMNNRCAERTIARHPQCVKAVRQRRVDEARRDPIMAN
jgi:hypothetical protein